MAEKTDIHVSRILLALDAWGCSQASLQRVISLAGQIKAQIHGIYIEDSDLLQIAQLPFSREISVNTAQASNLNIAKLDRKLRNLANELKAILEEQSRIAEIYSTFKTVRGQRIQVILEESRHANIVLLPGNLSWRLQQHQADSEHPFIVAIFHHTKEDKMVLQIAASLAEKEHANLMVFCDSEASKTAAAKLLANSNIAYHINHYYREMELLEQIRRLKPKSIVVSDSCPLVATAEQMHMLSKHLKCDLFITRQ